MKPDPTAFRVAVQTLGVAPNEAIFVDDALPNIRGAQDLGIHAIHCRECDDLRPEIMRHIEAQNSVDDAAPDTEN